MITCERQASVMSRARFGGVMSKCSCGAVKCAAPYTAQFAV